MKSLTDIAKECGIQFGESDVSRDIISRRQLERVIAAALAQHQAKALEGVEPVACLVNADLGAMVWPISDINEAGTYCDEGEFPELLYSATTVSALQARIAELDAQVASLVADIAHADSLLSAGNDKGDYFNIETEMCWLS